MGDQQHRFLRRTHDRVDAVADNAQRIDIQSAVGFVQHCEPGIENAHLHHLCALLFAAREADIHMALEHFRVELEQRGLVLGQLEEFTTRKRLLPPRLALRIERFAQELEVGDAGDFDRVLKAQKQAGCGAFVRLHIEQIDPVEFYRSLRDFVTRAPAQHIRQRGFARAIRTHDRVDFARGHFQRKAVENGLAVDFGVKIIYFQHVTSCRLDAGRGGAGVSVRISIDGRGAQFPCRGSEHSWHRRSAASQLPRPRG